MFIIIIIVVVNTVVGICVNTYVVEFVPYSPFSIVVTIHLISHDDCEFPCKMWDSAKDKTRIDQDLTPITNLTYHSLFLLNYVFTYLGIRKEIYL